MANETIYKQVQNHYGASAKSEDAKYSESIAQAFGYTREELQSTPMGANLGLSCGNPTAIASIKEGETVIDLGSGAGFDVFLAATKVGKTGRVIGIDMNKEMLARAQINQFKLPDSSHISFVEAMITSVPLPDGIADCIISNCVINLVPKEDKRAAFAEMARLVKPGGRLAVADTLARKELPVELRSSIALYVSCIAGCSLKDEYELFLQENGFREIVIVDAESDLNVYVNTKKEGAQKQVESASCCVSSASGCCSSNRVGQDSVSSEIKLKDVDVNEWVGSFKIFAIKS